MVKNSVEVLPGSWELPNGWTFAVVRVIHCLPDDQTDGWRVTLSANGTAAIEVTHRNVDHARAVALDAAAELFPTHFKGIQA